MAVGFTVAISLFGDIGIIGAGIVGGISGIVGSLINSLITKIFYNKDKNEHDFSTNAEEVNSYQEGNIHDEIASGAEVNINKKEDIQVNQTSSKNEVNEVVEETIYIGFGGWLYIVAIGLIVAFRDSLFYIIDTLIPLLNSQDWLLLTTPGNGLYHPMWRTVIYTELIMHLTVIVLIILIGYMCYRNKKLFKNLMISFILVNLLFSIIAFFMYQTIPLIAEDSFSDSIVGIIRAVIYSVIWIPYFLVSKRVKNTYIN